MTTMDSTRFHKDFLVLSWIFCAILGVECRQLGRALSTASSIMNIPASSEGATTSIQHIPSNVPAPSEASTLLQHSPPDVPAPPEEPSIGSLLQDAPSGVSALSGEPSDSTTLLQHTPSVVPAPSDQPPQGSTTLPQHAPSHIQTTSSLSSSTSTTGGYTKITDIDNKCPELSSEIDLDTLTQDEFTMKLTDNCRYDKLIKPPSREPLEVLFQFEMNHIESAEHLQLKAHILVQLIYKDSRLAYTSVSPKRGNILGEESLRDRLWVPHIIIANERESAMMGLDGKDVFVQINPDGNVIYSYRMSTMFYCWMNLQKFPFDHQICDITWISWAYNVSNLVLKWEEDKPFLVANNLHLTEYVLEEKWSESTVVPPSFDRGGLVGNYSGIVFKFKLRREIGYYIMDFFIPSILLVCTSWVTFWLQADAAAPRVALGTATMLSFITLNGGLTKNLPKVSYIKASEIWFLACASFIFFSLAEFAFVNVIWRRRKKVELKKQNSKHILKGALTPSLARKQLRKAESMNVLYRTRSCSSLDANEAEKNTQTNYLTVHNFPSSLCVPKITTHSHDELLDNSDSFTSIPIPEVENRIHPAPTWTTMTPQEVAMWIDKKSRIVFPVAFLIFNLFYWSFVYAI